MLARAKSADGEIFSRIPGRGSAARMPQASATLATQLDRYLALVHRDHHQTFADRRTIRVIAQPLRSDATRVLWHRLAVMRDNGINMRVVFTAASGDQNLRPIYSEFARVFGPDGLKRNIRICDLLRSDPVIEQIQFGSDDIWTATTGSEAPSCHADGGRGTPSNVALAAGRVSFEMLWTVSDEVPPDGRQ